MTEQPGSPQAWQFHLRNCDTASQSQPGHANWFGVSIRSVLALIIRPTSPSEAAAGEFIWKNPIRKGAKARFIAQVRSFWIPA